MLLNFWYRALAADQVARGQMISTVLLGRELVIGRTADGRPFALRDQCPHRGMPLSYGRLEGSCVECCYHGWKFEAQTGQCRAIPSLTSGQAVSVEKIYAESFSCAEQDGFLWIFFPRSAHGSPSPESPPRLPALSDDHKTFRLSFEVPVSADHAITSLMDPAHGPFVHGKWWLANRPVFGLGGSSAAGAAETHRTFSPIPFGFRMHSRSPLPEGAIYRGLRGYTGGDVLESTIDFELPTLRLEQIKLGRSWFASASTVTPLTDDRSRIDVAASWNVLPRLPVVTSLAKQVCKTFFDQDCRALERQARGLSQGFRPILIDDADRPARWYYQLKRAYVEWCENGGDFQHPLREPVTLAWRTQRA